MVGTVTLSRPCLGFGRSTIGNRHGRVGVGPHKPSPAHPHHCVPQVLIPAYAGGILVRTGDQFPIVNFRLVGSVIPNRPCCSPIVEWFNMDGEGSPSLPKVRDESDKNASDTARHSHRSIRKGRSWVLPCQDLPSSSDLPRPIRDNRVQAVHSWKVELAERIVRPLKSMSWKLAERSRNSRSSGN